MKEKYWLTRVIFIRSLAFIYAVAFLVALNQNEALLGESGLTPAVLYVKQRPPDLSSWELLFIQPTLFWFIEPSAVHLQYFSTVGLVASILVAVLGCANVPILFVLWALYFSIVSVGQTWYSFGWESQLLETGFLAMFMVPVFTLSKFPQNTPTPWVAVWGYRWLLFRIMIGAGAIKIRGDQCWRDLTCMNYHYQTQPVPNPFSILFHKNPGMVQLIPMFFYTLHC
jgi:lipase maturation factor 1